MHSGATVTCNFGRFAPLTQQTLAISFTIATSTVRVLTGTVSVAASTPERTPANNSASHSGITAAPTLASLPGAPYIYYGNIDSLTRIPLFGDNTVEPVFLNFNGGDRIAADNTRNRIYIFTQDHDLIAVDPDGSDRVQLADANPVTLAPSGRLHVAVDDATRPRLLVGDHIVSSKRTSRAPTRTAAACKRWSQASLTSVGC